MAMALWHRIALASLPLALALLAAACAPAVPPRGTPASPPVAQAQPAAVLPFPPTPGNAGAGSAPDASRQVQVNALATPRTSKQGEVTLQVRLAGEHPPGDAGPFRFSVVMDTHSVDLDAIDLAASAVLRDDRGRQVAALRWEAPRGGHHVEGVLTFPGTVAEGSTLHGADAKSLEMVIKTVGGVPERRLAWELAGSPLTPGGS